LKPNLEAQLLSLVNDVTKREFIASKHGDEFIKELARQARKEEIDMVREITTKNPDVVYKLSTNYQEKTSRTIPMIGEIALTSIAWSESYAIFLYLINYLTNPQFFSSSCEWLRKAYEKYPRSAVLKFLNAVAITVYRYLENQLDASLKNQFESLKKPTFDSTRLLFEALNNNPKRIVDLQEAYVELTENDLLKEDFLQKNLYQNFGKISFPNLSKESFLNIFISFLHARLSNYSLQAHMISKAESELNTALLRYKDNSYALVLQAKLDEDSIEAESAFNRALERSDSQYVGLPLQIEIKTVAYLGLGYVYHKRMIYDIAEKYYYKALELHPEEFLELTVLLNRGRNRLENGDIVGAREDMSIVKQDYILSPDAHNNLGLIYFKQGLNEKAEAEFIQAIELKSDFPDAYYNLGVLYNTEKKKERAEKLFQAALDIDRNHKEAKLALRKLQGSDIKEGIRDWYDWWFGTSATNAKKAIGLAIVALMGALIGRAAYDVFLGVEINQSTFGIIALTIVFLLLPLISKLKVGPVELEMESKGQQPSFG